MTSILAASEQWLESVQSARAYKTFETYRAARNFFFRSLQSRKIDPDKEPVSVLTLREFGFLLKDLKHITTSGESVYATAIKRFYRYLLAEEVIRVNPVALEELILQRARRPGKRVPQFYEDEIGEVLDAMMKLPISTDPLQRLRDYRDRALIITLAATGLRIHEAVKLTRGDVDWRRLRAIMIGKGDKEAVVRFTKRSIRVLKEYLQARSKLDGATGKPLASLPIFARHDTGIGKKVEAITTTTGRTIVNERVRQVLGEEAAKKITPHSFRHYFVTKVYQRNNDLKLAQALARHENIQITQRYARISDAELDRGYRDAMEDEG